MSLGQESKRKPACCAVCVISHPSSVKTVPGNTSHPPSVGLGDGWLPPLPVASRTRWPGRSHPGPSPPSPLLFTRPIHLGLTHGGLMGARTPQDTRSSSAHKPHIRPPLTAPGPGDCMIRSRENRWEPLYLWQWEWAAWVRKSRVV